MEGTRRSSRKKDLKFLTTKERRKWSLANKRGWGVRGKSKFWYGYKRNVAICMKSGLMTKVAVTPANITDDQGLRHICPKETMVFADKGYCSKKAFLIIKQNDCTSRAILKNNMRGKDFERDRLISKQRMPYERVFSKQSKKRRYVGIAKNQFQGFMQAPVHNFKRLISIHDTVLQEF